jgi:hypothetical protein
MHEAVPVLVKSLIDGGDSVRRLHNWKSLK